MIILVQISVQIECAAITTAGISLDTQC